MLEPVEKKADPVIVSVRRRGATMSTPPPVPASAPEATDPPAPAGAPLPYRLLGAAEAAIVITAVAVLAVLEHPVHALLTTLAAATALLIPPGHAGRLLAALNALKGGRP
ncbi:hypothetical protein ACM614_15955 [Streptomyces sp. 12297]|uniref:hypothetical protein n=1 Tax=Streptomyces sp. NBC_00239 TaxID=2903640 RepID=UPI002E282842|nr:hypothetical protein [Streptomyces sp. NBC_00239]